MPANKPDAVVNAAAGQLPPNAVEEPAIVIVEATKFALAIVDAAKLVPVKEPDAMCMPPRLAEPTSPLNTAPSAIIWLVIPPEAIPMVKEPLG